MSMQKKQRLEYVDSAGSIHRYCWSNGLPLKNYNKSETPTEVNLLEYEEINSDGGLTVHELALFFTYV